MAAEMEFCLLGSLVVRNGGVEVPVRAARQRTVLAALLLKAGRPVGLDELAEALWRGRPPPTARVTAQNYVMRLRNALGEPGRQRICTVPGGYMISVTDAELDVTRFEALVEAADAAAREHSWEVCAARADEALALWRGDPLAEAELEVLAPPQVPRLLELRLAAAQARAEARVHLGQHAAVIGEVRQMAAEHPLRERVHGLLMLALYQDGRQGEALEAYQRARRMLVEELGAEPGAALRALHQQILAGDPALDGDPVLAGREPAAAAAGGGPTVIPRQLPAGVPHFTGRAAELAALTRLLDHAGNGRAGTLVISAIGGTAGVGKTALAVHWAHKVAEHFPDGQMYVNLRGYAPTRPMAPADALAGFLRALGMPGEGIPADTDERAARYRSLLAGRRMLVVLDNAGSEEQIRPLLPGSAGSVVVATSRDRLAGLVARDGATRLDLDLLPPGDAASLLTALIGSRARADQATVQTLARLCCRLPLALRVAAEMAVSRPAASLASLAADLADQQRRLDLLDAGGDPKTAVRAVFSWSCAHLSPDAARVFRLAGLHPGPSFDASAAAALTRSTVAAAGQLLDRLARAHLIELAKAGRYSLHDLLRAYARELAQAHDSDQERHEAVTGLLDHYLRSCAAAMKTLDPAGSHGRPGLAASAAGSLTEPAAARAWLDAERATLAAAVPAAEREWPGYATEFSAVLYHYLDTGSHNAEAITIHGCARRAARRTGDRAAEAGALTRLGRVSWRQGHYEQAATQFGQALALCRHPGDQVTEAQALAGLGRVDWRQGRYAQAAGRQQRALTLFRQAGDRGNEAYALVNLGSVVWRQGHDQQACTHFRQALALFRHCGDPTGEACARGCLGDMDAQQGRLEQASIHIGQALVLFRQTGNPTGEACAIATLAGIDMRQGRLTRAATHYRQALALFRRISNLPNEARALICLGGIDLQQDNPRQATARFREGLSLFRQAGDRPGEALALNKLGEALLATGRPDQARAHHAMALDLASQIDDRHQQALAHHDLGRAHQASGGSRQAEHHWQRALSLYTALGAPQADQVRVLLRSLGAATS
ncbi:MAG TPA: BTAD domain-containing putative transcriptional regulator [Streptosporangiaceae bacterium]|jgi:DNA-binding SARP family transcriptional activator/Tfp pilus assembly protein PilF